MELTRKSVRRPLLKGALSTRRGSLLIAALCALAATGILVVALGQYRKHASTPNQQQTVLVATATIQKGTSGDAVATTGMFRLTPVLTNQVSAGALSAANALRGTVAARDILPGEQLTQADFVAGGGVAAELAPNQRAVSIALDSSHGLLDVLQAGDRVDVYGSFTLQAHGVSAPVPVIRLLIPAALVLKTPSASGGVGSSGAGGNVVVEVSDNLAPNLAFASDNGKIWLVLRPGNAVTPNQEITTIDSLLLGTHVTPGLSGGLPTLSFKSSLSLSGGH
jgi:Flp pilus assembly protein CpaB